MAPLVFTPGVLTSATKPAISQSLRSVGSTTANPKKHLFGLTVSGPGPAPAPAPRLALLRDSEQQTIERTISGSEVVLECIEGPLCGLPGLPVSSEADPLSTTALNLNEHSVHVSVTVESAALQASASGAAAPRVPDIVAVEDEDAAKRHVLSAAAAEFVIPAAAATESTESCSVQQVSTLMVASTSAPLSLAPAAAEAAPTPAGTNVSSSTVAPASASTSAAISAINTAVITSTSQPAGQLVASHVAASFPAASMAGSVMGMSIPGSVRSHKSHSHKDHNSVTIKADTRVKDAAGAIFKVIDRLSTAFVTALRVEPTHEALNRAVKSIAVARKYVHDNLPGMDVSFLPFYRMDNNNMPDTNRFGFLVFKLHLESYCSAFNLPAAVASLTTTTTSPCSISSTGSAAVTAPASCVAAAAATGAVQQWRLVESDHTELNVSRSSDVNKMANAVLGVVQSRASSGGQGVMKVGGSDALFKAMSAVINARKRLQGRYGLDLMLVPSFITEDTSSTLGRESKFLRFNIVPCEPNGPKSNVHPSLGSYEGPYAHSTMAPAGAP